MKELLEKVQLIELAKLLDYFIAFAPIVLSIIAVVISISTARKQNSISLFDKRYNVLSKIRSVLKYDEAIHDCNDPKIIVAVFDAFFCTELINLPQTEKVLKSNALLIVLQNEVLMGEFIFSTSYEKDFILILELVRKIVGMGSSGKLDSKLQEELHSRCLCFRNELYEKISKETKL